MRSQRDWKWIDLTWFNFKTVVNGKGLRLTWIWLETGLKNNKCLLKVLWRKFSNYDRFQSKNFNLVVNALWIERTDLTWISSLSSQVNPLSISLWTHLLTRDDEVDTFQCQLKFDWVSLTRWAPCPDRLIDSYHHGHYRTPRHTRPFRHYGTLRHYGHYRTLRHYGHHGTCRWHFWESFWYFLPIWDIF